MLVNPTSVTFTNAREVHRHLDRWAGEQLSTPEQWQDMLLVARDWRDYSARNQALLASYNATGPVAGLETWRLVPSATGGCCAVRSGEHGLPVRVPVTTTALQPDPHLGRVRATSAAIDGWEWRAVFCVEQLARRPDPLQLTGPDRLPIDDDTFAAAALSVARKTSRGRVIETDPHILLADAAGRQQRTPSRPSLTGPLVEQAVWLACEPVGRQPSAQPPAFDPVELAPRVRWESLVDVLDGSRRLTTGLGRQLEIDLLGSPLPRMEVADDRVVPAHRRNRLPRASVAQLPLGRWVEVGPYTPDEWAARGAVGANGRGAYLRLTSTAYVVAFEQGDQATWRYEDTRAKTGAGRLDGGDAPDLDTAKANAMATIERKHPQVAHVRPDVGAVIPLGTAGGWEELPGRPGSYRHPAGDGFAGVVIGLGDQWLPMVQRDGRALLESGGQPCATREDAMVAADAAAGSASRLAVLDTRVGFDESVAALATADAYTRQRLNDVVGTRLEPADRARLAADPTPAELVDLLGGAGVTPSTTVAVLLADGVTADDVGPLLPVIGIPPADGIVLLHEQWGRPRIEAAELTDATSAEMRRAGCSATEILAARPAEAASYLPADPEVWDRAAGTLAEVGQTPDDIIVFLADHAPDGDCFAAGLAVVEQDAELALVTTLRVLPSPGALAAVSERCGLSPHDTAVLLSEAGADPPDTVEVLRRRCDGDLRLTAQVARSTLHLRTDQVIAALTTTETDVSVDLHNVRPLSRDPVALVAAHQRPVPTTIRRPERDEAARIFDSLPAPEGAPLSTDPASLLAAVPPPDPPALTEAGAEPAPELARELPRLS